MERNNRQDKGQDISLTILRRLSPARRLETAFDLSDFSRELFLIGLRKRFPEKTEEEIHRIFLERIDKCQNVNY